MKRLLPHFAAGVVLPLAAFAQPAPSFTAEQVRSDLSFLYQTLQASHYDLFAHTAKEVFDREQERLQASITGPLDPLGAYRVLQPFAALAAMAHCNLSLPFQPAYVPYVMGGGTVIPFDVTFRGDDVLVWHRYTDDPALQPGDRIVALDGRPMAAIITDIGRFISGDNPALKRAGIETTGFPRLHWVAHGESKNFTLTVQNPGAAPRDITLAAIPAMQFEQRQSANKPLIKPGREFKFMGDTAYLRPGAFLNQEGGGNIADHATFDQDEFVRFLDASFRAILARRPPALIIDLRGNPGGDNSFSDPLVAYFAREPFRFCSRFEVRTSAVTKAFWQGVNDPALAGLKREILARPDGERFPVEIPLRAPRPPAGRYHGKVFVLVDRFSYSNAATTAALIQDYGFGKIVGEPTADPPTTYGAAHQFTLPHTQLIAMYPKAYIVRPNGDTAPRGVQPDHEIRDDVFTETDEILATALALAGAVRPAP